MNRYHKWTIFTLSLIVMVLLLWGGFNFYIDPLWNFGHANPYNRIQASFDERQQKTNDITHQPFHNRSLMLGSSRVTYIDQHDFIGYDVYNYAVSNMILDEYDDYIEYAKHVKDGDFEYLILGFDFYATNKNVTFADFQKPTFYIEKTNAIAYPFTSLLSLDTAKYAWENYQASKRGVPVNFAYDRRNVKTLTVETDPNVTWSRIYATVDKYHRDIYARYEYEQVREKLQMIKDHNPNTQFIVFTTPVTEQLFEQVGKEGLFPYYLRWLEDLVAVFGEVYHFMYPNSITTNIENFYDGSHIYPQIGTLLAHRLISYPDPHIPDDFGILLTRQNINAQLERMSR